jgi:hypothetical protein
MAENNTKRVAVVIIGTPDHLGNAELAAHLSRRVENVLLVEEFDVDKVALGRLLTAAPIQLAEPTEATSSPIPMNYDKVFKRATRPYNKKKTNSARSRAMKAAWRRRKAGKK